MGAFLNTLLLTKFFTGKDVLDSVDDNNIDKQKFLQQKFLKTDDDIFNVSESEDSIIFEVKEDVLKKELVPFLTKFYKEFHKKNRECDSIINSLKEKDSVSECLQLAEEQVYQNFQKYNYGYATIYHNNNEISIGYDSITLASEGKISMEQSGLHFSFFETLLRKVYADFKLSNLVFINIS